MVHRLQLLALLQGLIRTFCRRAAPCCQEVCLPSSPTHSEKDFLSLALWRLPGNSHLLFTSLYREYILFRCLWRQLSEGWVTVSPGEAAFPSLDHYVLILVVAKRLCMQLPFRLTPVAFVISQACVRKMARALLFNGNTQQSFSFLLPFNFLSPSLSFFLFFQENPEVK